MSKCEDDVREESEEACDGRVARCPGTRAAATLTVDGDAAKWEIVPDGKNPEVIPPQLSKSWRPSITNERTSEKVIRESFESVEPFQGR